MRRFLKLLVLAVSILFVSVQFVRPNKTNPPVVQAQTIEAHVRVTPEVAGIFERACKDCHSNETVWPWYAQVAPVSWFVTDHVKHGRRHLNFSRWPANDREHADFLLGAMCMTAERGQMPLSSYTRLHHSAKLSPLDVHTLCAWSQAERRRMKG
jgi:Haem-binding domain